jgi:hypothetical protein
LREVEPLTFIFTKLRNPHRHVAGSNPPDPLSKERQTWPMESCMSWIKSLVAANDVIRGRLN